MIDDVDATDAHADDTIGGTVCACVTMRDTVPSSLPCSMYTYMHVYIWMQGRVTYGHGIIVWRDFFIFSIPKGVHH